MFELVLGGLRPQHNLNVYFFVLLSPYHFFFFLFILSFSPLFFHSFSLTFRPESWQASRERRPLSFGFFGPGSGLGFWLPATGSALASSKGSTGMAQNRFGIPFWSVGEFTTHFRLPILVVCHWDVTGGMIWVLTHGPQHFQVAEVLT